ncbi:MAG: hypothetical protein ACE5KX_07100 [Acidimicrobiia bacterium]
MEIILFILLAGVWALFLLPSFMSSRKEAAVSTTRDYGRYTERLAGLQGTPVEQSALARKRVLARRRNALLILGGLAVITLVAAILTSSWAVLVVNLIVDALLAAYIAALLQIKQQRGMGAAMPPSGGDAGEPRVGVASR